MKNLSESLSSKPLLSWLLFGSTAALVIALLALAQTIQTRKVESEFRGKPLGELANFEARNEAFRKFFPKQFESYYSTKDTSFRSEYGGNEPRDMLEENPRMVVLWAGYAFSKDYKQGRGHYYAIEDIHKTLRTGGPLSPDSGPQPNTCWTCKSPDVPRLMEKTGPSDFYKGKWASKGSEVQNTIGCVDCHDPKSMNLRLSRPALKEAFARQGKNILESTHQEMRSLVCAQCHVEYYFKKGPDSIANLTFPWDSGLTVEAMEKYYDNSGFKDWIHKISKAPMLKAQHPDYEVYKLGIHARRGVACADCHMPFVSEGGQKYTSHKIQSPLNHISTSCQVCHRESEKELIANVNERHKSVSEIKQYLEDELVKAHYEAGKAWELGSTEEEMKQILAYIRQAQWRWDFGAAGHGSAFHAPLETARLLGSGLNKAKDARLALRTLLDKKGFSGEVSLPDISTKAKAQEAIGLKMEVLKMEKQKFIETILPQWKAEARQKGVLDPQSP